MYSHLFQLLIVIALIVAAGCSKVDKEAIGSDIDLEALSEAYAQHLETGALDLAILEARVNQKDIYSGVGKLQVYQSAAENIIGFEDYNGVPGAQKGDRVVFTLNLNGETQEVVANDEAERYYSRRSPRIFGFIYVRRMSSGYSNFYGKSFRPPSRANMVFSGYQKRLTTKLGSRSIRAGSAGSRRMRGGGFGKGK